MDRTACWEVLFLLFCWCQQSWQGQKNSAGVRAFRLYSSSIPVATFGGVFCWEDCHSARCLRNRLEILGQGHNRSGINLWRNRLLVAQLTDMESLAEAREGSSSREFIPLPSEFCSQHKICKFQPKCWNYVVFVRCILADMLNIPMRTSVFHSVVADLIGDFANWFRQSVVSSSGEPPASRTIHRSLPKPRRSKRSVGGAFLRVIVNPMVNQRRGLIHSARIHSRYGMRFPKPFFGLDTQRVTSTWTPAYMWV